MSFGVEELGQTNSAVIGANFMRAFLKANLEMMHNGFEHLDQMEGLGYPNMAKQLCALTKGTKNSNPKPDRREALWRYCAEKYTMEASDIDVDANGKGRVSRSRPSRPRRPCTTRGARSRTASSTEDPAPCARRHRVRSRTRCPLLTRARARTWRQSPERDGRQDEAIHAGVGQAAERADGAKVVLRPELMRVGASFVQLQCFSNPHVRSVSMHWHAQGAPMIAPHPQI